MRVRSHRLWGAVVALVTVAGLASLPAPAGAQLDEYPPDWNCVYQRYSFQGNPSGTFRDMFVEAELPDGPVNPGSEVVLSDVVVVTTGFFAPGATGELTVMDQVLELGDEAVLADPDDEGPFGPVMWGPMDLTFLAPDEAGEYELTPEFFFLQDVVAITGRDFECSSPFGTLVVEEPPDNGNGNGNGENGGDPGGNGGDPGGNGGDPGGNGEDPEGDEDPTVRTEVRRIQAPADVGATPRFTG